MSHDEPHLWLADPTTSWTIALTAELPAAAEPERLADRLARLNRSLSGRASARVDRDPPTEDLLEVVARPGADPVCAGTSGRTLAVAGHHQFVDGLAMLAVLTELTGLPATSTARGVENRPSLPFPTEVRQRLVELAVAPPARVARTAGSPGEVTPAAGTTFARRRLERHVGVAELVHACAAAVLDLNRARGASGHRLARRDRQRVAIAVGASRRSGQSPVLGDHSELLRLRSAERLTLEEVRDFLRTAPLTPSPGRALEGSGGLLTRAASWGVRLMGPRLGSTVTVSHLGRVETAADLTFYPVCGGSSGVSVGAVTQDGRTTLGARGRARDHSAAGLGQLLDALAERLASSGGDAAR